MHKITSCIAALLIPFIVASSDVYAQSTIKLSTNETLDNEDLMNVLRFQGIAMSKVKFTGTKLWGKDFKISIRDYANGKLIKSYELFDSKEDDFFKIKEQEFSFSVLAQSTSSGSAKIDLRFPGFGIVKEFKLAANHKDFALKSFQEGTADIDFQVGESKSILTFVMPYKTKNGSTHYPDLLQAEIKPEDLGKKLNIPRYFLIDLRFD